MKREVFAYGHGNQVGDFVSLGFTSRGMELVYSLTADSTRSITSSRFFQLLPASRRTPKFFVWMDDAKIIKEYNTVREDNNIQLSHPTLLAACEELVAPLKPKYF